MINKKKLYDIEIPISWGGPVDEHKILILHTNDYEIENVPNPESEKSNFTNESEVSTEQSEVSTEQSESNTFMIYVLILSIFIILLFIYINIRRNKT